MSRLPGDWVPPYPEGLDRLHEKVAPARPRRHEVRLTNVKQVMIEQGQQDFRIHAQVSGDTPAVAVDLEPGVLYVHVRTEPESVDPSGSISRAVTIPPEFSIENPMVSVEGGRLVVTVQRTSRASMQSNAGTWWGGRGSEIVDTSS